MSNLLHFSAKLLEYLLIFVLIWKALSLKPSTFNLEETLETIYSENTGIEIKNINIYLMKKLNRVRKKAEWGKGSMIFFIISPWSLKLNKIISVREKPAHI